MGGDEETTIETSFNSETDWILILSVHVISVKNQVYSNIQSMLIFWDVP